MLHGGNFMLQMRWNMIVCQQNFEQNLIGTDS